jgi:hypothetical protein
MGDIILSYVAAPEPPPVVQSVALYNGGDFSLTFSAQSNRTCVLQYTTNLSALEWINISTHIIPPAGQLAVTNAIGGDAMRFYRIFVVP